jgi:predicted nucleotidyltransferase
MSLSAERWVRHTPLPQDIQIKINNLAKKMKDSDILLAYLFGSMVNPKGGRMPNDVDLAVVTKGRPAWELRDEISELIGSDRLDLVDLGRAPPVLRYEIIRTGRMIFSANDAFRQRFVLDTLHLYRDTDYLRRRQADVLRRRITKWKEQS